MEWNRKKPRSFSYNFVVTNHRRWRLPTICSTVRLHLSPVERRWTTETSKLQLLQIPNHVTLSGYGIGQSALQLSSPLQRQRKMKCMLMTTTKFQVCHLMRQSLFRQRQPFRLMYLSFHRILAFQLLHQH